jgi:hypothetical protein
MKQHDETVHKFLTRFKKQASTFAFNDRLELLTVEKIVTGLKNRLIEDRFMEEDHEKLGLPEALKIAIAKKGTVKRKNPADINYIQHKPSLQQRRQQQHFNVKRDTCKVCGKNNHSSKKCFYKDFQCDRVKESDGCKRGEKTHGFSQLKCQIHTTYG